MPKKRNENFRGEIIYGGNRNGLWQVFVTYNDTPFAAITMLEFLNLWTSPQERKALRLDYFTFPDPPLPKGPEDQIGLHRNQRYENEVSENHISLLLNGFPRVVMGILSHSKTVSGVTEQSKWAVETPSFDRNRIRIMRDAGGVEQLPGVMRYPFADIVPVDKESKKILEKKMPSILGAMHLIEKATYEKWLEVNPGGPGTNGILQHELDKIRVYDVIFDEIFGPKPQGPKRPVQATIKPKPGTPGQS